MVRGSATTAVCAIIPHVEYQKKTLKTGLRVITVPKPDSPSAVAMVLVGVGSRHEPSHLAGISHFIEHNVFKGTKSRPRRNQIAEEIEGFGGVTNAATGHEYTFYWAKAASSQINKILDVVMDVSLNMTFPKKDLEIERGNVIEEINMYQDNPPARLRQDFFEFVWGGHPVGRKIIGRKETVGSMTRGDLREFVKKNYLPERMVVVAAGDIKVEKISQQVSAYYGGFIQSEPLDIVGAAAFKEFQESPRVHLDTDQTQQTHLCLGVKTFDRHDPRHYALDLLNTILGQGMSSRLFRRIREELGLAYYIGSANYELNDTGLWFARAGVDTNRAEQAIKAILQEFKSFALKIVGTAEIRKAKEYVKGRTLLGFETSDELAEWYGFRELLEEEMITPADYNQRIEAVSAADLKNLAGELLREDRLNLGVVGPFEDKEKFEKILRI